MFPDGNAFNAEEQAEEKRSTKSNKKSAKPKRASQKKSASAKKTSNKKTNSKKVNTKKTATKKTKSKKSSNKKTKKTSDSSDSKGKNLVIVESPAKAHTINKILGSDYLVKSSVGHIRDLPKSKLGIDIENDFAPKYVIMRDKTKVVKELRTAAKNAKMVFLAPDLDREGEAIAWHLENVLGIDEKLIRRVIFNEITERAIRQAFENPGSINIDKVNAQQARRILDRLVGYKLSPLLWKKVKRGLSAGRVQSVAARLICEREQEIQNFSPHKYYTLEAELKKLAEENPKHFVAQLKAYEMTQRERIERRIAENRHRVCRGGQ